MSEAIPMAIRRLDPGKEPSSILTELSDLLIAVIAAGGSVGFMHPLARESAESFWTQAFDQALAGKRVLLGAFEGKRLCATVSVLLDMPPNQRHRGEIAKMMTHPDCRGRGLAAALLAAAEQIARAHGKSVLTLDTASVDGASTLYERMGYCFAGELPDYALTPHGQLSGTRLYWKRLGADR